MTSTEIRELTADELHHVSGATNIVIVKPDGTWFFNMAEKEIAVEAIGWAVGGGVGGKAGGKPKQ